jgi:hypothetical protein
MGGARRIHEIEGNAFMLSLRKLERKRQFGALDADGRQY